MASLTLRPWTRDAPDSGSLKDVLARVASERGHFRDITEASLQEEIAGEGALELSESEDESEDGDKQGDSRDAKPNTREDLFKRRDEMLRPIDNVLNDFRILLDSISLQTSSYSLDAGKSSMSPALKQAVPPGVMSHDLWHKMPHNKVREAQDERIAANVRLDGFQRGADTLLAAASRLEDNSRKEKQFWDQMLSIMENGWNICKLPGQRSRLGVTYGFSESAPEFSRRGVAALSTNSDDGITLERGIGSKPRAIRVTLKRDNSTLGISKVPKLLDDGETTLEARIRHARNSLYDEELYHEMIRESRGQGSLGVNVSGGGIVFQPDSAESSDAPEVLFELVSLDDLDGGFREPQEQDALAQAIAVAAKMLLGQAHREKVRKRSAIPPLLSERKEERSSLPILRPIMSFLLHQAAVCQVNTYLASITSALSAAAVDLRSQPATFNFSYLAAASGVENLVGMLMQRWTSEASLSIESKQVTIGLETSLAQAFSTLYTLTSSNGRTTRFTSLDELRHAGDANLASMLAQHLQASASADWKCNTREALLVRPGGEGKNTSVWVALNGEAGVLGLNTPTQKLVWSARSSVDQSLQQAWVDIAA